MKSVAYIDDMETWRRAFSFSIPIKIRFSETDMFGHVNNVSSFIYFEEGRIEFLKAAGLFSDTEHAKKMPVVADLQCDYHRQLFFNEEIRLYVKVNETGNSSFDIHYLALNHQDEVALTGRGRMVYIDTETGKPVLLDESFKKKLLAM